MSLKPVSASIEPLESRQLLSAAAIDTTITGIGISNGSGYLNAGHQVTLTVNFDSAVTVDTSGGAPSLSLSNGTTASYGGTSGSTALNFNYTVLTGQNSSDLSVTSLHLNGATIRSGGVDANLSGAITNPSGTLVIDTTLPAVQSIHLANPATSQATGPTVTFTAIFSEPVTGVDASDFEIATTGNVASTSINVTPITTSSYTVTINGITGDGSLGLNLVDDGSIRDQSGNALTGLGAAPNFSTQQTFATGTSPIQLAVGDVNGDGQPDIVTTNVSASTISVLLGNGNGTFQPVQTFPVGFRPYSVVLGDLNGDSKLDLMVTNYGTSGAPGSTLSVLLGNGDGTFQGQTTIAAGTRPYSAQLADLNGDGKLDITVTNTTDGALSILMGNGDGTFQARQTISTGIGPSFVQLSDLNGDGKPDIVYNNAAYGTVNVLLGNGDGTFQSRRTFAAGNYSVGLAVGDVNGDGSLDLVAVNEGSNNISVLLGNGDGTFQGQQLFDAGGQPINVALADLNGDGKLDIAVDNYRVNGVSAPQNGTTVSVLQGNGNGTFQALQKFTVGTRPIGVVASDVNGDGKPDLLVTNVLTSNVSVLANITRTTFTGDIYTIQQTPVTVASITASGPGIVSGSANLNVGDQVILTVNFNTPVNLVTSNGAPSLTLSDGGTANYSGGAGTTALTFIYTVVTGQNSSDLSVTALSLNGATMGSNVDLSGAATNPAGTLRIDTTLPNVQSISFADPVSGVTAGPSVSFTVTFSEAVGGVSASDFQVVTTGDVLYSQIQVTPVSSLVYTVTVSGVTGSGSLGLNLIDDGSIRDQAGNALAGLNSAPSFQAQQTFASGATPKTVAAGDVNRDGITDLVVSNFNGTTAPGTVSVLLGNGDGTFKAPVSYQAGVRPYSVSLADLNGDGRPDIIVTNYGTSSAPGNSASVFLGNGDGTFQAQQTVPTGLQPSFESLADLNGDGKLDLVTSNTLDYSISVMLGNGDGTFKAQQTFATSSSPFGNRVSDLNGDGKPDIVVANFYSANVGVLLGNGDGTFQPQQTFATGSYPNDVAIGDVNGDGKSDLVIANDDSNDVSVLLGNGDGTFQNQHTFDSGARSLTLTLSDLNADGKLDIVVNHRPIGGTGTDSINVLQGNGDGTFKSPQMYASGIRPNSVIANDINQDGKPDLIFVNPLNASVGVLINNTSGQFTGQVYSIVQTPVTVTSITTSGLEIVSGNGNLNVGDSAALTVNFNTPVNVDTTNGVPSLVLSDGGTAFYGGGSGSSALTFIYTVAAGQNSSDLGVISLRLNGATFGQSTDLTGATTNPVGTLRIDTTLPTVLSISLTDPISSTASEPFATFSAIFSEPVTGVDASDFQVVTTGSVSSALIHVTQTTSTSYSITISGITGNGTLGLNLVDNGSIRDRSGNALTGNGIAPNFQAQQTFATPAGPIQSAVGDINGDGFADVVSTASTNGLVSVLLGNGDGTFQTGQSVPTGFRPYSIVLGDLNGDSKLDLVVANYGSGATPGNTLSVLLGNGDGTFQSQQTLIAGARPYSAQLADLNGDGKLDIVATNTTDGALSILMGNGDGTFQSRQTITTGIGPSFVQLSDLNGDGKADIAYNNAINGTVNVLLGNGDGTFQSRRSFAIGSYSVGLAVGDVNGDGMPDLVAVNEASNSVSVLLGNGDGTFQGQQVFAAGGRPVNVALADLNGDGHLDIVVDNSRVGNVTATTVSVLQGNGDGSFQNLETFTVGSWPAGVAATDVNGDGKPDLVVTNFSSSNVSILTNTTRATFTGDVYTVQQTPVTVTSITASGPGIVSGNGILNGADEVTLTVNLDSAVIVNTTNGTPTLSLSDGGTANYAGGSGTSALTFIYTVVSGQNSSDLSVASLNLNGATIGNTIDLNSAVTNPPGTLRIDTTLPIVQAITYADPVSGIATGPSVSFTVTFSEAVVSVSASDFQVVTTGSVLYSQIQVTPVSNLVYTVTVSGVSGSGSLGLNLIDDGSIRDQAGNALAGMNSAPSFQAQQTFASGATPKGVAVSDVNSDGIPDLVVTNFIGITAPGTVSILLGNGDGTFQAPASYQVGSRPYSVAVSDLNGDGRPDIIATNYGTNSAPGNSVSVLLGNGDGTFQPQQTSPTGLEPNFETLADLNGDGKLDLVTSNSLDNSISVLLGNGNGTFRTQQTLTTDSPSFGNRVADLNGDGKPDLVVANYYDSRVSVYFGNGDGTFQPQQTLATGSYPNDVAIGDVNGDGKPDLVVANTGSNNVSILLGNGDGSFQSQKTFASGSRSLTLTLNDFNADGRLDIAVTNRTIGGSGTDSISVLQGNGDGTFQSPQTYSSGLKPSSVTSQDINQDGKPDLIYVNPLNSSVGVLINNTSGQLSGPTYLYSNATTISVSVTGGTFNGSTYPATATVTDANGETIATGTTTLMYYSGTDSSGTGTTDAPTDTGTYTVVAFYDHAGGNFSDATSSPKTFSIAQAAPSVVVTDASGTYNGSPFAATTSVTGVGGLAVPGSITLTYFDSNNPSDPGSPTAPTIPGTYNVFAAFESSDSNYTDSSSSTTFTIGTASTTTSINTTASTVAYSQLVTFTATISVASPGAGVPTGNVSFLDGTTVLGTGTLGVVNGQFVATFTTANLSVGDHQIQAVYNGDSNFISSTSSSRTETVTLATTSTAISSSSLAVVFGQPVTFTAKVGVISPGVGVPTGTVTFKDGITVLGTGTLSIVSGNFVASFTLSNLAPGNHSISASYNGDTNFKTSTSPKITQSVTAAATSLTISSSSLASVFGQAVTLTATIAVVGPGSGTPTGSVTFKDGSVVLGAGTLSVINGIVVATLTKSNFTTGNHSISATYAANTSFQSSTSSTLTQVVAPAATTLAVTSSNSSSIFGQSVTFTATIADISPGAGTPTGTITFLDGTDIIGTGTLKVVTGKVIATLAATTLSAGNHAITATYAGDTNSQPSVSSVFSQVVSLAGTTSTVTSSVVTAVFGQSVTLTATVVAVAPGAGIPTGTIAFLDGTTLLGTGTLSVINGKATAILVTSSLEVASHTVTVSYTGDSAFNASTSAALTQKVIVASTTSTLTSSTTPTVFGQTVTLTAKISVVSPGAGTPTGTVTFKSGATVIGSSTVSISDDGVVATLDTSNLAVGNDSLSVIYSGDANFKTSTSATTVQVVTKSNTATSLLSSNPAADFGETVVLTANIAVVSPGSGTPTGTVTFTDGSVTLGTGTLTVVDGNVIATYSSSKLALGTHSITASYAGNTSFIPSTSLALAQIIGQASTNATVTSSVSASVVGQSVTLTATVAAVAPGAGIPTGTVTFMDGSTVLGTGTLSVVSGNVIARVTTTSLAAGDHSITALYSGNANFEGTTSASFIQTVNPSSTTTTITASPASTVFGQTITFTATVGAVSPGAGMPTGTVTFFDGTDIIGTGTLGIVSGKAIASFATNSLSAGSHSISVSYDGSTNFQTSTSTALARTVNVATTTATVVSSAALAVFGQSVTLTATIGVVSPGTGIPTGTVTFLDGTSVLGTGTLSVVSGKAVATYTLSNLPVASHSITAIYSGDDNFATRTSAAITQRVVTASTTVTLSASASTIPFGQPVTFTAIVGVVSPGQGIPTGTVSFKDGSTVMGTAILTVIDGVVIATFTKSNLAKGNRSITASYSGDAAFKASVSSVLTETVI